MIELSDATKEQFNAPWYVFSSPDDEITVIENESGHVLAELDDVKTANRLARLPELYEALMEATKRCCSSADDKCPKQGAILWTHCRKCNILPWLELLRKVRDGK